MMPFILGFLWEKGGAADDEGEDGGVPMSSLSSTLLEPNVSDSELMLAMHGGDCERVVS